MMQWTEGTISSYGTKLHFYRNAGPELPLVLLHGVTDDGMCWSPMAEALSAEYDIILVDLRGHGKSDAPEEGYELATMANEVAGLIVGLRLEKPVVIGHSLGAVTALTLAGLTPELPRALILEDPPAFWSPNPPSQEELQNRAQMHLGFEALKNMSRTELLEMARSENPIWADAELEPWADSKIRFDLRVVKMLNQGTFVPDEFPELLRKITCPVLLITSDPHRGAIVTDDDAVELQKSIPQLQRVHIPGAGHNIRREQFSRYMQVVQSYLNRIETED